MLHVSSSGSVPPRRAVLSEEFERRSRQHILAPEDIFTDPNDISVLDRIVDIVEKERDDYEEYWEKKRKFELLMKKLDSDTPLFQIPTDMLMDTRFYGWVAKSKLIHFYAPSPQNLYAGRPRATRHASPPLVHHEPPLLSRRHGVTITTACLYSARRKFPEIKEPDAM